MTDDSLDDMVYPFRLMRHGVAMQDVSYTNSCADGYMGRYYIGRYRVPQRCGFLTKHVYFSRSCGASTQPT